MLQVEVILHFTSTVGPSEQFAGKTSPILLLSFLLRTRNMRSECVVFSFNPSRNSQYILTWTGPMARSGPTPGPGRLAGKLTRTTQSPSDEDNTNSHSPGQPPPRCTAPFVVSAHACALRLVKMGGLNNLKMDLELFALVTIYPFVQ